MPDTERKNAGLLDELRAAIEDSTGPEICTTRAVAMWAHDEIIRLRAGADTLRRAAEACRNVQAGQMVGNTEWFSWVPAHLDVVAALLERDTTRE